MKRKPIPPVPDTAEGFARWLQEDSVGCLYEPVINEALLALSRRIEALERPLLPFPPSHLGLIPPLND